MRRAPLLLVALFVVACGGAGPRPEAAPVETVVLISLDGFRHDYPDRVPTPTFARFAAEGARGRLIPPFPSTTFPSHATIATGVSAGRHGIVNNEFHDRERGRFKYSGDVAWYDAPPLWIHAERQGARTHVFHWIGIEGAMGGVSASVGVKYDKTVVDDEKVDRILEWVRAPAAQRPRLVMSYFKGCDDAGHDFGPESPEVDACIVATDARLGRLAAGLDPARTTLVVVSDHGMIATRGEIDPDDPFAEIADVVAVGPVAHVYLKGPEHLEKAREIAGSMTNVTTYERGALPASWAYEHPQRTGDLVLLAAPGWHFLPRRGEAVAMGQTGILVAGHHGHPPEVPEMGAVFFAWGARVQAGARADVGASDVAPTVVDLLGLTPMPGVEGRVITGILEAR